MLTLPREFQGFLHDLAHHSEPGVNCFNLLKRSMALLILTPCFEASGIGEFEWIISHIAVQADFLRVGQEGGEVFGRKSVHIRVLGIRRGEPRE